MHKISQNCTCLGDEPVISFILFPCLFGCHSYYPLSCLWCLPGLEHVRSIVNVSWGFGSSEITLHLNVMFEAGKER